MVVDSQLINKQYIKLFILLQLFFVSMAFAFDKKQESDLLNLELQKQINKIRIKYNLPALSVSIKLPKENNIRNYVSGYYTLSNTKKINALTLFQIGSITKSFTATLIFKLVDENKINLNDKLEKWLPQYPRWKNITIKDLLEHTSGIYNYTHGEDFDELLRKNSHKYWTLDELAALAYHHKESAKPGKKYNYTNSDYILLGLIIEKVSHQSLQSIFNNYFQQHHLKNTYYFPSHYPSSVKNNMAHGYNRDGTFKNNQDVTFVSMSYNQSAGAMISNPEDIIYWLENLFNGKIILPGSLTKMTQIISEDSALPINLKKLIISKKKLSLPFFEIGAGSGIGLVYFRNFGIAWVHSGGTVGYESFYAYNPCNGITLALAYNVKPREQLVFINIANSLFSILNNSKIVNEAIAQHKNNNSFPFYCKIFMDNSHRVYA